MPRLWGLPFATQKPHHQCLLIACTFSMGGLTCARRGEVTSSMEAFLLVVNGQLSIGSMLLDFTLPVLFGNVVGGTALFALISYAQVAKEI